MNTVFAQCRNLVLPTFIGMLRDIMRFNMGPGRTSKSPPAPGAELHRLYYDHPLFDLAAIDAQHRLPSLQGKRRTWFAGAWTGCGFHEDGLKSAVRVAADFNALPDWATAMKSTTRAKPMSGIATSVTANVTSNLTPRPDC